MNSVNVQTRQQWADTASVALPAIADVGNDSSLVIPFAARLDDQQGEVVLGALKGYVRWSWPGLRIVERRRLLATGEGASETVAATVEERADLDRQLLLGAYEALQSSSVDDLRQLSPLYRLVIPAHLVEVIHTIVPTTRNWLAADRRPESSAAGSPAIAAQLNAVLAIWTSDLFKLADECEHSAIRRQIEAVSARLEPAARPYVVAAGEAQRGKTTLLNRVLGREVLPPGPTRTLVRVTADDVGIEPGDIVTDAPLLRDLGIDVVDTPGSNDTSVDDANLRPMFLGAAATVLVVSATSPLSMSERRLLETLAIDNIGSRAIVAVSMLDRIDPGEQDLVVKNITSRVQRTLPGVHVVRADDPEVIALVLRRVVDTSVDDATWAIGTASALGNVASRLARDAAEQAEAAALDEVRRDDLSKAAARQATRGRLLFERLESDLRTRRIEAGERVRSTLANSQSLAAQQLESSLRYARQPAAWWSKELTPLLLREVDAATRTVERRIAANTRESLDWLSNELNEELGIHPLVLRANAIEIGRIYVPTASGRALRYTTAMQHAPGVIAGSLFAARLAAAAALGTVLPGIAIAGVTYVATVAFSRASIGQAIDEAVREIPGLVETAFAEVDRVAAVELDRSYSELRQDLARLANEWAPPVASLSTQSAPDRSDLLRAAATRASDVNVQIQSFVAAMKEPASP